MTDKAIRHFISAVICAETKYHMLHASMVCQIREKDGLALIIGFSEDTPSD